MHWLQTTLLAFLLASSTLAQEISWAVPEEGGTPRDTNRIELVRYVDF